MAFLLVFLMVVLRCGLISTEYLQEFEISEGLEIGTTIGFIGHSRPEIPPPPYLIVPVPGSAVDSDLQIDQSTGEIRSNKNLDREVRSYYSFVAIPLSGENIRVEIKVTDENDNAPTFPVPFMNIEFPENTPRDMKRTLHPAKDLDLGVYNTERYEIVSGNKNNAFRLSSHRGRDEVLYLDLQVNGFLDRETTPFYSLVVEAYDGGTPPLKGSMTVNITIEDVNDNQPIFNQSRYFATIAENATLGTSVLRVLATDTDIGENGRITYSINRRQSDRENKFAIDSKMGIITVNKPLDFESKVVHELVIVARDNGQEFFLETTAFVSIHVIDVNDNQPTINLIFLSEDASPKISEDARPGDFVARISVNDADSKEEYANVNVTLQGGEGYFGLTTQDSIIYLVIVSHPLDREVKPNYTMVVTATDQGNPPLNTSRTFDLCVTDTNDNAPEFDHTMYYANVLEVADPGTSVFQLSAVDRDEGNNSVVSYSIKDTPETNSQWFEIDSRTGLITTRIHIDCETNPTPQITVVATDNGVPPLSSSATVLVTISDVNDNEPIFDQSFYNVTVAEDESIGSCFLKISATDADCGVNANVNYTLGSLSQDFILQPISGDLCIAKPLDHESKSSYEIPVLATDRGGLSCTAVVKVQVMDVNDNRPVFYPEEYNVSLPEGELIITSAIIVVVATDNDSGRFGQISYEIIAGNDVGLFQIDHQSGEIFVIKSLSVERLYHLIVSAKDGGGLTANVKANVYVSVFSSNQRPPVFKQARYNFFVQEDSAQESIVGKVTAISRDPRAGPIRYAIYSGDPEGFFTIDPGSGTIRTKRRLDHEKYHFLLLNVQAACGRPPIYGHTQVNVTIWDVNDNAPRFSSNSLKISIPENADLSIPIYVVHAEDPDSNRNGEVHYYLLGDNPDNVFFVIGERSGSIVLQRSLDYETRRHYILKLSATDLGSPPLSSNVTLMVEVQDVNDNAPTFEKNDFKVNVIESLSVNTQFFQVTATDMDTGNNARLTYKLSSEEGGIRKFGIFPNSGYLYLKEELDRESGDEYTLTVTAADNGIPPLSSSTLVYVRVLDANDNDPQFVEDTFQFAVEENLEPGQHVGTLSAHDKDLGNNASLRYALLNSNGSFQINPVTGEIFTKVVLDRENYPKYELTAEVKDQGTPFRSDRALVEIKILDVNDNAPVFLEPAESIIEVLEKQPLGTEVVQVIADDADQDENGSITYEIAKGSENMDGFNAFSIDSATGVVKTRKLLDHENEKLYTLTLLARDKGSPALRSELKLQIQILDLNDNHPVFPSTSVSFKVKEGISVGQEVGVVQVVDEDRRQSGRIMYSIVGGNLFDTFDIIHSTGSLYTIADVDFEKASEYHLQIKAYDNSAVNPYSRVISVKIEVEDMNDCAPVFKNDPVLFSIPENTSQGTLVWNFSVTDSDGGINGQVAYLISQQSPISAFEIDKRTGALSLVDGLDYESFQEYTIIVTATDQARDVKQRMATSVTCKILVEDKNDNSPIFKTQNKVTVVESEPLNYPILHVIATDKDSRDNGKVTYIISNGNKGGHFALDYDTGLLTVAKQLDREVIDYYELNITASDHGRPSRSSFQVLHIYIEDANDNAPKFKQRLYQANVSEAAPNGTFVTKVQASDGDLGDNGKLTYWIPKGVAQNKFSINSQTGEIQTASLLDREDQSSFLVTVYVKDGALPSKHDVTTVKIELLDVNDHAPKFSSDSCYTLRVPENSDFSVIHTLVATDKDLNSNAEVTYKITDGNTGNKFSIDLHSGELASRNLDREQVDHYRLLISAHDQGEPPLAGMCNITVIVLDQNDNDPQFEQNEYSATIAEDIAINSTVLIATAHDPDTGVNGKITYSLRNESHSLFRIDSFTGAITTAGTFDREKKTSFVFEVQATDGGLYDARSARATIQITIADVNDNRPIFTDYPFLASVSAHAAPGTQLIQLEAEDRDEGPNGEVFYSFTSSYLSDRFHLDTDTGIVTVAGSLLADAGKVFHCEIEARDRGQTPRVARGVLEIQVGDVTYNSRLHFQNESYNVRIFENAPSGKQIVQVKAASSYASISYSIKSGNEENSLNIDSKTGVITIGNSVHLDYEATHQIRMLVMAYSEGRVPLHGYATLTLQLRDENDNSPSFPQEHYVSSVWEGINKGTFVTQVTASDEDQDGRGTIIYHIIEGNHDNAFIIDPPFSGTVKTNIVLDREIRDTYHLTIVAVDDGSPQLTGTCTLHVNIIDLNDNQPVFPPHSVVSISEGAEVGTVITTITANDVDTNPALIYNFADGGNPNNLFSIDRFSGRITLAQPLDHEKNTQYLIQIYASDSSHVAETSLTVHVTDVNDNPPVFHQQPYQVSVPEMVDPGYRVISLNATDSDSGVNSELFYNLTPSVTSGFFIDQNSGTMFTNKSLSFDPKQHSMQVIVSATDKGLPPRTAVSVVHIQVVDVNNNAPKFANNTYRTHISENANRGSTLLKVSASDKDKSFANHKIDFSISGGNVGNVFAINGLSGDIILMKSLDREVNANYTLKVTASDRGSPSLNSTVDVYIYVDDENDNSPIFNQTMYQAYISEFATVDSQVLQIYAEDRDAGSKIVYDITSGNEEGRFNLHSKTGIITVKERLDYETESEYKFIVRATDSDPQRPLSALAIVMVKIIDENDNAPRFPVTMYREAIEENSPTGSPIFMAHAIDADRGPFGKLNYSVTEGEGKEKFKVDPETGLISSLVVFDYESKNRYFFTLMAVDSGGKYTTVQVQVDVESKDEYPPEFSQNSYYYTIPGDASIGYLVGNVHATDLDEGIDGRIAFQLRNSPPNFAINSTTGIITVKSIFHREGSTRAKRDLRNQLSLYVFASSGRPNSLSSSVVVDVLIDYSLNSSRLSATEQKLENSLPAWGIALVIVLSLLAAVLLGMIFFLRKRTKQGIPNTVQSFDNSFDTIDIHHPPSSTPGISQYPPRYSDISHFDPPDNAQQMTGATSEVSDQSHSASSGRGSAFEGEDVEDEEIRMINEGPLLQQQKLQRLGLSDSGFHKDDDNVSEISVHNTQEYLARLGINTSQSDDKSVQDYSKISSTRSVESMHMFDEEEEEDDDVNIGNLIYPKLHDVETEDTEAIVDDTRSFGFGEKGEPSMTCSLSSIVHSEEELTGSYNWDYLLDWGPQYQPLAHVFAEIARLKDDSVLSFYASSAPKTLNPQVKTVPPPLITNVAPRSIAPVALNTGHPSQVASLPTLPHSPIGHDSTFSSSAMSPNFSPALSPLATRSPSISPLVSPVTSQILGPNASNLARTQRSTLASSGSEAELKL